MNSARWIVWLGSLSVALALGGCSKSEEATTAAKPAAAPSATPRSVGAANPSSVASSVVPATAVQPVVQADPIVVLRTSVGDLYVRLYEKQTPRTVGNFLSYVHGRFYDGTIFHQVESGYAAMGGGYDERRRLKSARYPIPNEATHGLKNVRGSLAMARDPQNPHSATSLFFINLADNAKLDHHGSAADQYGYCVFGQVIDGLDVLDKLSAAAEQPVVVKAVQVVSMTRDDSVRPAAHQAGSATP